MTAGDEWAGTHLDTSLGLVVQTAKPFAAGKRHDIMYWATTYC